MSSANGNRLERQLPVSPRPGLATLLLCGLLLLGTTLPVAAEEEAPRKVIKMTVENFKWVPDEIAVPEGTQVVLQIRSYDATHRFDLKKPYNLKVLLPQDETTEVEFVAKHVGTFKWKCGRPCGDGCPKMVGKLTVYKRQEGGGDTAD